MATLADHTQTSLQAFLFTDIVGSTDMKRRLGDAEGAQVIAAHDVCFRDLVARFNGVEQDNAGDGFFATFPVPSAALQCALAFQAELADRHVEVRAGVHMGEAVRVPGAGDAVKLVGMAVDTAGRVMSLALPKQVLITRHAFDSARQQVLVGPDEEPVTWLAHGSYHLKGLDEPIEIYEAGVEGTAPLSPPPDTEKARRAIAPGDEETLGWRPSVGLDIPGRGDWRLQRKLGAGGFGEVWVAVSARTKEQRAFKFCFQADRLRNLKRELTLFRLLREALGERDDIARLYDVRLDEAPFFLELEYTPDGSLDDWAAEDNRLKTMTFKDRAALVAEVADALGAAHSVGVLHKDVKPSNVLVRRDVEGGAHARLTDFGIGQLLDPAVLGAARVTAAGFTETVALTDLGSRTGTRIYMAPELFAGKPASIASDVYALGVLLYQVILGELERPLGQGWERDISDPLLVEDVAACVAGNPKERLASCDLLAARLRSLDARRQRLAEEEQRRVAEARRTRLLRLTSVAAVVLLIATVAGFVVAGAIEGEREEAEDARQKTQAALVEKTAALEGEKRARGEAEAANQEKVKTLSRLEDALRASEGLRVLAQSSMAVATNPKLALRLAVRGHQLNPGELASDALLNALEAVCGREGERKAAQTGAANPTQPHRSPSELADLALAAYRSKKPDAVAELLTPTGADPWLVVDVLLERHGQFLTEGSPASADALSAAKYLAEGLPEQDAATLVHYAQTVGAGDQEARRRQAAVRGALAEVAKARTLSSDLHDRSSAVSIAAAPSIPRVRLVHVLGGLSYRVNQYEDARALFATARRLAEDIGWVRGAMAARRGLAHCASAVGKSADAIPHWLEYVGWATLHGRHDEGSRAMSSLAECYGRLSDYPLALRCLEVALIIPESENNNPRIAAVLVERGEIYSDLGSYDKAVQLMTRAVLLFRKSEDQLALASALARLGGLLCRVGLFAEARKTFLEVTQLARQLGDMRLTAVMLASQGRSMPGSDEGLALQMEALSLAQQLGDQVHITRLLGEIGDSHLALGRTTEARRQYERAYALAQKLGLKRDQVRALGSLARLEFQAGNSSEAMRRARAALARLPELLTGLSLEESYLAYAQFSDIAETGLSASVQARDLEQACRFLEAGRASAMHELIANRRGLDDTIVSPLLHLEQMSARRSLTSAHLSFRAAMASATFAQARKARTAVRQAQVKYGRTLARIERSKRKAAGSTSLARIDLKALQARLRQNEAFLYYGVYLKPAAGAGQRLVAALVVRAHSARLVPLGELEQIVKLSADEPWRDRSKTPAESIQALRRHLVDPLKLAADVSRIILCPDWQVLHAPPRLLFDGHEISIAPSGSIYALLGDAVGGRGSRVLAIGDPEYGSQRDPKELVVRGPGGRLAPLPATRKEARAVGDVVLLGREASVGNFLSTLRQEERWRAVHIATHCLIELKQPLFSMLAFSASSDHEGYFTMLDALHSSIPADLAVLSACDTNRGRVVAGEGVLNFAQAFFVAGAPRVICALWKVDDAATQALMIKFYELWKPKEGKGLETAAALKQAQDYVRKLEREELDSEASQREGRRMVKKVRPWAHPYYWAGWVLWGLAD